MNDFCWCVVLLHFIHLWLIFEWWNLWLAWVYPIILVIWTSQSHIQQKPLCLIEIGSPFVSITHYLSLSLFLSMQFIHCNYEFMKSFKPLSIQEWPLFVCCVYVHRTSPDTHKTIPKMGIYSHGFCVQAIKLCWSWQTKTASASKILNTKRGNDTKSRINEILIEIKRMRLRRRVQWKCHDLSFLTTFRPVCVCVQYLYYIYNQKCIIYLCTSLFYTWSYNKYNACESSS